MTEREQQRFEIILERIEHDVHIIAEGYGVLDEKIERFHQEAKENHRLVMNLLKYSYDELDQKIDGVYTKLDKKIDEKIDGVLSELRETKDELSAKIETVGDKVDVIDRRETTLRKKVEEYEDRMRFLERKVA